MGRWVMEAKRRPTIRFGSESVRASSQPVMGQTLFGEAGGPEGLVWERSEMEESGRATCWRSEVSRDVLRRPPRPRFPPSSLPSSPPPPHVLHNIQRTSSLRLRVPRFLLTNHMCAAQTPTAHRRGDSRPTAPGRHGCSHRPRVRNHPHRVRQHSGGSAHASGAARRA